MIQHHTCINTENDYRLIRTFFMKFVLKIMGEAADSSIAPPVYTSKEEYSYAKIALWL